jgi:uncharacterized NAD(P)/FAD-binding protein YdhS
MSAFHDQPSHFIDWLRRRAPVDEAAPTAESFVSRRLYGTHVMAPTIVSPTTSVRGRCSGNRRRWRGRKDV